VNHRPSPAFPAAGRAGFDILRGRIEVEVVRPAVIAITSSTADDGREIATRALAESLASTGYLTLWIETSLNSGGLYAPAAGLGLAEIGQLIARSEPTAGSIAMLNLGNRALQNTTSQMAMESTLDNFRSKFHYVVISTEFSSAPQFASSIFTSSDAVFVSVKMGRRQKSADVRLAAELKRIGSCFMGAVAIDPAIVAASSVVSNVPAIPGDGRHSHTMRVDRDRQRREIAEPAS
jgi:hypothetical protein